MVPAVSVAGISRRAVTKSSLNAVSEGSASYAASIAGEGRACVHTAPTAMIMAALSGRFIGPAGRDQTSGTPKPAKLPTGADDPAEGRRPWAASEQLTGVPFDL